MFFGDGELKGVIKICPRMTPVAMATKFETKLAITQLVYRRDACSRYRWFSNPKVGDFLGQAIE